MTPLSCNVSTAFLSQGTQSGTQSDNPVRLYAETFGAGSTTFVPIGAAQTYQYNAIAVNPADNYIYGQEVANGNDGDILRINPSTARFKISGRRPRRS